MEEAAAVVAGPDAPHPPHPAAAAAAVAPALAFVASHASVASAASALVASPKGISYARGLSKRVRLKRTHRAARCHATSYRA